MAWADLLHPPSHLQTCIALEELSPVLQLSVKLCSPHGSVFSLGWEGSKIPPVTLMQKQWWEGCCEPGFQLGAVPWHLSGCDMIMHLLNIIRSF